MAPSQVATRLVRFNQMLNLKGHYRHDQQGMESEW